LESHLPAAAGRRRPLPTRRVSPGTGLTLRSSWCRDFRALRRSSSSGVPLPCHSQRSRPVLSGQPRTTPQRPRPAPFSIVAGGNPARSGFASRGSIGRGLHQPGPRWGRDRAVNDRNAADNQDSHSHHLSSSAALPGRAPQATVTRRFALTRKGSQVQTLSRPPRIAAGQARGPGLLRLGLAVESWGSKRAATTARPTPAGASEPSLAWLSRSTPNAPAALGVRVAGSVRVGLGPGGVGASVTRPAPGWAGPVLSTPGPPAGGGPRAR
jgi:hypothetical protein